jgi:large conductance mechanosensitive channel
MLKDFKAFLMRGNMLDLAVAVVIGTAFGAVITALVKDLITPVIAAIGGKPDFSTLTFTINKSKFLYGDFINAIISFVIIAAAVFFLVIKPVNALMARMKRGEEAPPEGPPEDVLLLREIRDALQARGGGAGTGPGTV